MPKLKLLIFDANIVIKLHELGLWQKVIAKCEAHLSSIVINNEVKYWHGEEQDKLIDLSDDVENKRLQVFDRTTGDFKKFRDSFGSTYSDRFDDGETESLIHLVESPQDYRISSADKIVYKVLGYLNRSDQGISLEEVLQAIGLGRSDLDWAYSKGFREKYTQEGQQDSVIGLGNQTPRK